MNFCKRNRSREMHSLCCIVEKSAEHICTTLNPVENASDQYYSINPFHGRTGEGAPDSQTRLAYSLSKPSETGQARGNASSVVLNLENTW